MVLIADCENSLKVCYFLQVNFILIDITLTFYTFAQALSLLQIFTTLGFSCIYISHNNLVYHPGNEVKVIGTIRNYQ